MRALPYLALLGLLALPARAQIAKITADVPEAGAALGSPLVASGDWLFAGATGTDGAVPDAGAVYAFRYTGAAWMQHQVLTVPGAPEDQFGYSLAADGNYLLAGTALADRDGLTNAGAVYVFRWNGSEWERPAELVHPDPPARYRFGGSVALRGDIALVSGHREDGGAGKVYLYRREGDTWRLAATLAPPGAPPDHYFGYSVALGDGVAFVGAANFQVHKGFVYVFEERGGAWELTQTLQGGRPTARAFGRRLLFDGARLFVGDALDTHQGPTSGAMYVYAQEGGTWKEQAEITRSNAANADYFGDNMTRVGPYLVVASREGTGSGTGGVVDVFEEQGGTWTSIQTLPRPALSGTRHFFGANVASSRGLLYVSAHADNEHAEGAGAVYVYRLDGLNPAPTSPALTVLPNGTTLVLAGDPAQPLPLAWTPAVDPEGEAVTYRWELSLRPGFDPPILTLEAGTRTQAETTYGALAAALTQAGVAPGLTERTYHRVVATDGHSEVSSAAHSLFVSRGSFVSVGEGGVPTQFALEAAYPNPFNPATTVAFALPAAAQVRLAVYDALGREVAVLADGTRAAGRHRVVFEAGALPSGLYLVRLAAGSFSQTRRVLLVK